MYDKNMIKNLMAPYEEMYAPVFENPVFIPQKHTKQSYRAQQRADKKRRAIKAKSSKRKF